MAITIATAIVTITAIGGMAIITAGTTITGVIEDTTTDTITIIAAVTTTITKPRLPRSAGKCGRCAV